MEVEPISLEPGMRPVVEGPEDIAGLVDTCGFLPFFRNTIPGYSVEEMTPSEYWFNPDREGPWEWKGPAISIAGCAYGKIQRGRACFVSRRLYPDLANARRDGFIPCGDDIAVLEALRGEGSLLTNEIRECCGFPSRSGLGGTGRRGNLETCLARLQMACLVVISDFEYKVDKRGNPYGWGVARYTRAEEVLGEGFLPSGRTPDESFELVVARVASVIPETDPKAVTRLVSWPSSRARTS